MKKYFFLIERVEQRSNGNIKKHLECVTWVINTYNICVIIFSNAIYKNHLICLKFSLYSDTDTRKSYNWHAGGKSFNVCNLIYVPKDNSW